MTIFAKSLTPYRDEYHKNGCVLIPSLISSSLLSYLAKYFSGNFVFKKTLGISSSEFSLVDPVISFKIDTLFNNPDFIEPMSEFLGKNIFNTMNRLYYVNKDSENLVWHDDSHYEQQRFCAIRIELSESPYSGGDFHLRDERDQKVQSFRTKNFGDAVLFKIEYGKLYHMVDPVTEGERRSIIIFINEA